MFDENMGDARGTNVETLSYKAPSIKGVNMFEGKTKVSLTQFVSGDSFGEAEHVVRVSQVRSDFSKASGVWERIGGGTHDKIDAACQIQKVQLLELLPSGEYEVQHCADDSRQGCHGAIVTLPSAAFEGSPEALHQIVEATVDKELNQTVT